FFAANPFLVISGASDDYHTLLLAGFDTHNLGYQSSAQRFTNRRARLQHDLAMLIAYGAVQAQVSDGKVTYAATDMGRQIADETHSLYARSYRRSAAVVVKQLNRLSDTGLREQAGEWLRADSL